MQRPVILNSIDDVVTRGDLLERAVVVQLDAITAEKRRTEKELWDSFDANKALIMGGLMTLTAKAVTLRDSIKLDASPRMADFCKWGEAVTRVMGREPGTFVRILKQMGENASVTQMESSPVFSAIERLVLDKQMPRPFTGSATELLNALDGVANLSEKRHPNWPKSVQRLSGELRRLQVVLQKAGIEYSWRRDAACRTITLRLASPPPLDSQVMTK